MYSNLSLHKPKPMPDWRMTGCYRTRKHANMVISQQRSYEHEPDLEKVPYSNLTLP